MRVDLTINIPTILSILGLVSAVVAYGTGLYSDLNVGRVRTDLAVTEMRERIAKNELATAAVRTEAANQIQTIRIDMRSDVGEIKGMLNQIIFGQGVPRQQAQQQLREWSK